MKTRLLHTDFWIDDQVSDLSVSTKFLYMYLFTNPHIGTVPIYKLSNKVISFETGLTISQIEQGKISLQELGKVKFYRDFVYILNADRYNKYHLGKKTSVNYRKEFSAIPEEVKEVLLSSQSDTLSGKSDTPINHKPEIIKHKQGVVKGNFSEITSLEEKDFQEIADRYSVPIAFVRSKYDDMVNWRDENPRKNMKDNWKATLRNWVKRDAVKIVQDQKKGLSRSAVYKEESS